YRLSYGRMDVFPNSEACEAAFTLNHNRLIWSINGFIVLESLAGLLLSALISIRIFKHEIFHINQRILLVLTGAMLVARSILTMYKRGLFLFRLLTYKMANTVIVSAGYFPSAFFGSPPIDKNTTYIVFCTSVAYPEIQWVCSLYYNQFDVLLKFRQFPVMIASMLIFVPSTRIVYPNMVCFTVLYALSSACTTYAVYLQSEASQVDVAVVIKELGSLVFNAHLIVHPLILVWREPSLWRSEKKQI
ncbi:hypothetical protein PMAYCL1PPCAC_08686, partial [Pristionchus mayeri]